MIVKRYTDFRYLFGDPSNTAFDGKEFWDTDFLRTSGFANGLTGYPKPIGAFPVTFSVNALSGGYDWYLSQRTDSGGKQYLKIVYPNRADERQVRLSLTALCVSEMKLTGATESMSEDELKVILTDCWLYCRRASDDAFQVFDLLKETLGV